MERRSAIYKKNFDIGQDASPSEIMALAKEEGIELSDEQLEQISGGNFWSLEGPSFVMCDWCDYEIYLTDKDLEREYAICPKCGDRIYFNDVVH